MPSLESVLADLADHQPFVSAAGSEALYELSMTIGREILRARQGRCLAQKQRGFKSARAAVRRTRRFLEQTAGHPWPGTRRHRLIQDLDRLEHSLESVLVILKELGAGRD